MPPAAALPPLGAVSVRPLVSVPVIAGLIVLRGVLPAPLAPMLNTVAIGVPRVSIESPRLGWLPLTKSRAEPARPSFHR